MFINETTKKIKNTHEILDQTIIIEKPLDNIESVDKFLYAHRASPLETNRAPIEQKFDKIISDLKIARSKEEIRKALLNASPYKHIKRVSYEMNNAEALLSVLSSLDTEPVDPNSPSYGSTENTISKLLSFLNYYNLVFKL